jgi:hypothetical protein
LTRRRLLASSALAVLAVAACAAAALAVTGVLPLRSPRAAAAQTAFAAGVFAQSNSRDGAAILGASAMRPGDAVSGEVKIANSGDLAGAFRLSRSDLGEQPGAGGGLLSARLALQVLDVTDPAAPATVWSGALGTFTDRDLGTFQPRQARTYRFTATFPDTGPGADNAFAGASTTTRFVWTASAEEPVTAVTPVTPVTPSGRAVRTVEVSVPGATVTLSIPGACVRRGAAFKARLSWKKQKRKGNVFVKVRRTDFFVGSRRVLLDRRAPFSMRFKVPLSAVPGSTLTVRARAFIKVRKGKSPKKSIRAAVEVCR